MRVNVGDFVLLNYLTFTGNVEKGIFFIVYHECYDIPTSQNFVALKVSTKPSGYQIKIDKGKLHFLDKESFINCSSPHRFQEQQVIQILGRSNDYYINRVLSQLDRFHATMENQLLGRVSKLYFDYKKGDDNV